MTKLEKAHSIIEQCYGKIPATLDEVAQSMVAVISKTNSPVAGFAWQIRYEDEIANTHSSPVEGVRNFSQRDELPCRYPGFKGRVWIRYYNEPKRWSSDSFGLALGYPGSGGGGAYKGPWTKIYKASHERKDAEMYPKVFSWDFILWLDDWPSIKKMVEMEKLAAILADKKRPRIEHSFEWTDPDVIKADAWYIDEACPA